MGLHAAALHGIRKRAGSREAARGRGIKYWLLQPDMLSEAGVRRHRRIDRPACTSVGMPGAGDVEEDEKREKVEW